MNHRKHARGQQCTLNFVGICDNDRDTTVLCHVRGLGFGEGTSRKPDDRAGVYGCFKCHQILDRVDKRADQFESDRFWYVARALVRTRIAQEAQK